MGMPSLKSVKGYVISFLTVFNIVFALVVYSDIRLIYFTAGYNQTSPFSIVGRSQEEVLMVGKPLYGFYRWFDSWYVFSVWHDLLLVLVISCIVFVLGIGLKLVIQKMIKIRKKEIQ